MKEDLPPLLPDYLQNQLNLIIHTSRDYWEQKRYQHVTNHGSEHSERVYRQRLLPLCRLLPDGLTPNEMFVLSAATWLYEIGMQSPKLMPNLDFERQPGQSLTPAERQQIREKRHFLAERLILDSVRKDYVGPPLQLGLVQSENIYARCIADVCRWCSLDPLITVPEMSAIKGEPIRLRLLVALLRLADQLDIEASRINLELLPYASLSLDELTKWWLYQYVQVLLGKKGLIDFYYHLPFKYKEYLELIRSQFEQDFKYENNPIIQYLWSYGLHLSLSEKVHVKYEKIALTDREELGIEFLRRHLQKTTTSSETPLKVKRVTNLIFIDSVLLVEMLIDRFSKDEFRMLCFQLRVNYDDLGGERLSDQIRELVTFLRRRDRLPELVAALKELRPSVNWNIVMKLENHESAT